MHSEYKIKCLDCGDIITAIYDSREKRKIMNYVECSCGKLSVQPDYHSYNYDKKGKPKTISSVYQNLIEDYFIFDEELDKLYAEVKEVAESLGFEEYRRTEDIDGKEVCYHLELEKDNYFHRDLESLNISLKFSLRDCNGWSQEEIINTKKRIVCRLKEFKRFLETAKKDDSILSNADYLWNTSEFNVEGDRKQVKLYDYKFWF